MAMGLIAAALGGAGKALSSIGEMEAKKQNEAKLRKELMNMESEERLRLDDIMFQRKQERAIPEAQTAAKANVAGQVTTLDERSRTNLPEREAAQTVTQSRLVTEQKLKQDTPKLEAQLKVQTRLAELAAGKENKLDEVEARAKYNAFLTDIRIAKELGVDVAEAERAAEKENARISALITKRVPANQAKLAGEIKIENIRVESEKEMIDAEADLLLKKWNAAKEQRDAAAIEKVQNEIKEFTTKAGDPKYRDAVKKLAIAGYVRSSSDTNKKEKVTTADLLRKLQVAEDELAEALGVSDKKKVNEEIRLLTEMANSKKNPDPAAKEKLKDVEQLRANVKRRRDELQNWRDEPPEKDSDKNSGKGKPSIGSFNK